MIEFNEIPTEETPSAENYDNYSNADTIGCKLCLTPIFFEPDKFITADFQIEVRNLCPGSRIALIVEVRRNTHEGCYQTLATVHDIFNVPNCTHHHRHCRCQTVTRTFRDVILDLHPSETRKDDPCNNLNPNDLTVTVVRANYISRNDSSCRFRD